MALEKEHIISLLFIGIAAIIIMGGYSSITGSTVSEKGLVMELDKTEYTSSELLKGQITFRLDDFLTNLDIILEIDNQEVSRLNIKNYLDASSTPYSSASRVYGSTKIETVQLDNSIIIPLSAFSVTVPGPGKHTLKSTLSEGNIEDSKYFNVR